MKLGLFKTNTKAQIADMRREQGPMLELLDLAERYVVRNIRSKVVIGKAGMRRQEIPEVPLEAIRETLANALCHRDYTTGTSVQVNVFKDFVEIVSPGLFPEGDSPEKHLSGDANEFHPRNPLIAEALYKADVIEQYGTGIPRIKETCEAAGVSFKFEQTVTSTVVRFNLPGARGGENAATPESATASIDAPTLSENERIAIDMAAKHGKATPKTLASQAQISRKTASLVLKGLEEKGVLRWSGKSTTDPYQFYGGLQLALRSTAKHCEALRSTALRSTAKHCEALRSTAKHCEALRSTAKSPAPKHCAPSKALRPRSAALYPLRSSAHQKRNVSSCRHPPNPQTVGSNPIPTTECSSRPSGGFFVARYA